MADQVQEIKQRLDIVDVISEYITLKQAGVQFKALCPFHTEKSPSFTVSRDRQSWHCFGCSEGGDMFSFVQKIEGVEFIDALRQLAKKAGIELERQDPKQVSQRNRLYQICQLATDYWHKVLLDAPAAASAREYLVTRGITQQTIEQFKIGYAKDSWDDLGVLLRSRGFRDEEIFLAGLAIKKERGAGFYDRFRDRIVFPINELQGRPVGFSARTMRTDEAAGAKYINTPQTELYNKSQVVFNLDKAKLAIRKANVVVLVEGQMDVIASVQAGVENVVAVSGTALTVEQVLQLKRFTENLAIALDADAAGQKAIARSTELIQDLSAGTTMAPDRRGRLTMYADPANSQEMNVRVIVLPYGKDPDECIRHNPDDWRSAIDNAMAVMDYFFLQVSRELDLTSALGKKNAAAILLRPISRIANRIEQTHWLQKLAQLLNVSEQVLRETLDRTPVPRPTANHAPKPVAAPELPKTRVQLLAEHVFGLLCIYPESLTSALSRLPLDVLPEGQIRDLYTALNIYYNQTCNAQAQAFVFSAFLATLGNPELQHFANGLAVASERDFAGFDTVSLSNEVARSVTQILRAAWSERLRELADQLRTAEIAGNNEQIAALSRQFSELTAALQQLS